MTLAWAALPLTLQASAMLVDELYFHRRRGLPRWERIGHPIDTLSVLTCYALALLVPPVRGALGAYTMLAALSCLLVTKDEFIHARRCTPAEHWLHAVLFVLHPIVLGVTALLWMNGARAFLFVQAALMLGFLTYQAVYWNTSWFWLPSAR